MAAYLGPEAAYADRSPRGELAEARLLGSSWLIRWRFPVHAGRRGPVRLRHLRDRDCLPVPPRPTPL